MNKTKILRTGLFVTAVFNLMAALMLAFPATIGKIGDLPSDGTIFYPLMLSMLVGVFGLVYGWMAFQTQINRPLLTVAAIGKAGVFIVSLYCLQTNAISFRCFSVAIGDLAFALLFFWWLLSTPR